MGWFDEGSDQQQAHDAFVNGGGDNKPEFTHELAAGGAAFFAAREYEKHCEKNGQPPSHAAAKELLAGFAGAFLDREVEPRMENAWDRHQAQRDAVQQCQQQGLDQQYGQ